MNDEQIIIRLAVTALVMGLTGFSVIGILMIFVMIPALCANVCDNNESIT